MQKPESCDEGYSSACSQYTLPACLKSTVLVQTAAHQIIHTAAPEPRRQTDSDMRTARPPVFRALLFSGSDAHFSIRSLSGFQARIGQQIQKE